MPALFRYTFDYAFRAFLIIIPFMTVLSIFFRERLGIPGFAFIKELLLFSMLFTILWAHISWKMRIVWSGYDLWIAVYIVLLLGISVFTTGLPGIVYGGRYDFAFLIAFFTLYHGFMLLEKPASYYLKLFLISGGIMLTISMLLKWPLSEDLLLYLGYSGNPSNWQFGNSVPIFHGVDGANVRRFQWLLDGPNTMGAFILVYVGMLIYFLRNKKAWHFLLGCSVVWFFILILYTYSRSAALGFIGWVGIVILFSLREIFRKYKVQFIVTFCIVLLMVGGIFIQYAGNMKAIIQRGGSTNGHLERMQVGIERFISAPLWQGLSSAWPWYRYVQNLESLDRTQIEEKDRYYIPESWYIQQLVEWGIFWFLAFVWICLSLLIGLYRKNIILAGMFVSILIMNMFLHTFESAIVSLSLFLLIGLILAPSRSHGK